MVNNTDQVLALANELQQAAAGEDIPSAAAAYADCAGRLRTLAKSLASAPPSATVGVKRWPFVESPGEFTERLAAAMQEFPLIGAVRHVLIENPPALSKQPAAPDAVTRLPDSWRWAADNEDGLTAGYRSALRYVAGQLQSALEFALAQQPAAPSVEAVGDWVLVPRQPTLAMANAAWRELESQGIDPEVVETPQVWDAMLAAAPQQPAAPSGEAVAWLRMKPDGTPDWAEDCIGSDDHFLDHEMASDGYYLQPLYAAPQQPAGVDWDEVRRVAQHIGTAADYIDKAYPDANMLDRGPILRNMRRWHERLTAALAAQQQGGRADG